MKRNQLFLLALAACAAILSACSAEIDSSGNPAIAGENEAIVTVSMQFPGAERPAGYAVKAAVPGGYADNDVPPGVALDAEKEIRSIAFIAFTTGGTGVYLSTEPTFAETGFVQPLAPVDGQPVGNYTASFKIRSDNFTGKTTLVAVANFHEHGLTFDPGALTIESLKAMLTVALEADKSIEYPLLMTIAQEFDIVEGATVPVDFKMERIMARVDVLNSAYDKQTPANGFVLTSARLLSAAAQGTMIGGQEITAPTYVDLKVQSTVSEVEPAEGDDLTPVKQQLAPIYAYENANSEKDDDTKLSATATAVEVKGTYKGKEYSKTISFVTPKKVVNGALEGGDIVPLARNTRYVIEIIAANETDVTFDLQVTDWAEGKQLDVELDFAAPVLELDGFTPGAGATWDATTKTLNITNATAGTTFELLARGNQDSDFSVESSYDENATKVVDGITVVQGELAGYADAEVGSLSRTYKISVPQAIGEYPSLTKVILFNTSYADAQTVITVKYAPFFVGGWESSQPAATIDPAVNLIDLKNVADGQSGTVSFFASSNSELTTPELTNKGITADFYTVTAVDETEKYGPGKRVTLSYKAPTEKLEFAEVKVADTNTTPASQKVFVKCVKNPYALTTTRSINRENTIDDGSIYLGINNTTHGTLDYEVYANEGHTITLAPTVEYVTDGVAGISESAKPKWGTQGVAITSNEITETLSDYKMVKRLVKVSLPTIIKNPAEATSFKLGIVGETAQRLIPVYVSGLSGIAPVDKALQPVLVKDAWWAPVNVGQTKISVVGDPSTAGGNIFQWGRKQPLTWDSPAVSGPVAPTAPEVTQNIFIATTVSPYDWCNTPTNQLWNSGTESEPIKTPNDPCPVGWRIPTKEEWVKSIVRDGTPAHVWTPATSPSGDQNGLLIVTGESGTDLFFPAAGRRNNNGPLNGQGTTGYYWSSAEDGANGSDVRLYAAVDVSSNSRGGAFSVRCVQE